MTIFAPRRSVSPKMSSVRPLQTRSTSMPGSHVKPPHDRDVTPTAPDEELFADINWPEDEEDEHFNVSDDEDDETPGGEEMNDSPLDSSPKTVAKDDNNNNSPIDGSSGNSSASGSGASASPSDRSGRGSTTTPTDPQGNGRFPKEVRSILRTWYHEHRNNPYPTSEQKDDLVAKTGLKRGQISLWLANARRKTRSKKRQDSILNDEATSIYEQNFKDLKPMDRWKVLPLENEPVAGPLYTTIDATYRQIETFFNEQQLETIAEHRHMSHAASLFDAERSTTAASYYDNYFQQSMASYETGQTEPSLMSGTSVSDTTGLSYSSLSSALANPSRHAQRERRRRRCHANRSGPKFSASSAASSSAAASGHGKERLFQCTFCPSTSPVTFATKHDWARHEKSQHLSLDKWICCASGGTLESDTGPVCAFCDKPNPTPAHLELHNFSACQVKDSDERTFYRKDHFQQHLRLTHESKFNPRMSEWREEISDVKSRCGFCNATFATWSQRQDHLAAHFKCRATMKDWTGDWGLEPHILAMVEKAGGLTGPGMMGGAAIELGLMPPPLAPASAMGFVQSSGQMPFSVDLSCEMLGKPPPSQVQMPPDSQGFFPYATTMDYTNTGGLLQMDGQAELPDLTGIEVLDWANIGV